MTIAHLCNPQLVFVKNKQALAKTPCGVMASHKCLPSDINQLDWFLLANLVDTHSQENHTKVLCAQFIRYLILKRDNRPLDDRNPVPIPKEVDDTQGVWLYVNETPLEATKEPTGVIPPEMSEASYTTHYKILQNSQYIIGCKQQLRNTPKAFPKSVAVSKIIQGGVRKSPEEQRESFIENMCDMQLQMVTTKNKTTRLEYKLSNGQSATSISFITDNVVTVNRGIHYECWLTGEQKCVRNLKNPSKHFAICKADMKLGVDIWPLLHSDMAVTAAIGSFASYFMFVLKNIGTKGSGLSDITSMYPFGSFSKKLSHYIFGNNESMVYKNKFIPMKMPYVFDNFSSLSEEQREDYTRLMEQYRTQEYVSRGSNYCSAVRTFYPNNIVEPVIEDMKLTYKPLWNLDDIGKNLSKVYKGFLQISIEPVFHMKTFTCRLQFVTGILKPVDADLGRLDAEIPVDEIEDEDFKNLICENTDKKEEDEEDQKIEEDIFTISDAEKQVTDNEDEETPQHKRARFGDE